MQKSCGRVPTSLYSDNSLSRSEYLSHLIILVTGLWRPAFELRPLTASRAVVMARVVCQPLPDIDTRMGKSNEADHVPRLHRPVTHALAHGLVTYGDKLKVFESVLFGMVIQPDEPVVTVPLDAVTVGADYARSEQRPVYGCRTVGLKVVFLPGKIEGL